MANVFALHTALGLVVAGTDNLFPARRLYCVGRKIMTHTPAGVAAIGRGDTCRVEVEGLETTTFTYKKD